MALILYTAHYRYSGPDRLDITVKGQHPFGRVLAPRWEMVMAVHNNGVSAHRYYMDEYWKILESVPMKVWDEMLTEKQITLVCFDPEDAFCHRNLVVEYMRDYRRFPVIYKGWRTS